MPARKVRSKMSKTGKLVTMDKVKDEVVYNFLPLSRKLLSYSQR